MGHSYSPWCTLESVRSLTAKGLEAPEPPAGAVAEAHAGAQRLAHDAWVSQSPSAQALAERILYAIHIDSGFAAPIAQPVGVIWQTLIREQLRFAFALGPVAPFDPKELPKRMEKAIEELGAWNHPLLDEMMREPAGTMFGVWSKNWYGSTHGYTFQMTSIAQRLAPESDISAYTPTVFKNLSDELADEFTKTAHHVLRYRVLTRAGVSYDVPTGVDNPDMVTEAFGLSNFRSGVAALADPMYALGNVYGIEANWVLETPKLAGRLREKGFDEKSIESYSVHATLDVGHAKEWLDMIAGIPLTPAKAARILNGAISGLAMRRRMYDAVRARFKESSLRAAP